VQVKLTLANFLGGCLTEDARYPLTSLCKLTLANFIVGCLMGYAKYSLPSTIWVQYLGQFNVGFGKRGAKY